VPERIFAKHPGLKENSSMVVQYEWDYDCDLDLEDKDSIEGLEMSFGNQGTDPADYIYIYENKEDEANKVK
jgi:hypothetical protein